MFSVLIVLWGIFIVFWLILARGTKPTQYYERTIFGGMPWRMFLVVMAIVLLGVPVFSNHILPENIFLELFGVMTCFLGIAFAMWARRELGALWSAYPSAIKKDHQLIQSGPYRLVRHPIYSGIILGLFGSFLADGTWRTLIPFLIISVVMIIRAQREDVVMTAYFQDAYVEYRKKTKSIIPGIF
jgi:protein-S-isoprenylcysteine O-methyltransferase Ste14